MLTITATLYGEEQGVIIGEEEVFETLPKDAIILPPKTDAQRTADDWDILEAKYRAIYAANEKTRAEEKARRELEEHKIAKEKAEKTAAWMARHTISEAERPKTFNKPQNS